MNTLKVWTDGSAIRQTRRYTWGWVTESHPTMPVQARVHSHDPKIDGGTASSVKMEYRAVVNALHEFSCRKNLRVQVFTDLQHAAQVFTEFAANPSSVTWERMQPSMFRSDFLLMHSALRDMDFEVTWVHAHSGVFMNAVVDQMLRDVAIENMTPHKAEFNAVTASVSGEAVVWHKVEDDSHNWRSGYVRLCALNAA